MSRKSGQQVERRSRSGIGSRGRCCSSAIGCSKLGHMGRKGKTRSGSLSSSGEVQGQPQELGQLEAGTQELDGRGRVCGQVQEGSQRGSEAAVVHLQSDGGGPKNSFQSQICKSQRPGFYFARAH